MNMDLKKRNVIAVIDYLEHRLAEGSCCHCPQYRKHKGPQFSNEICRECYQKTVAQEMVDE